MDIETIPKLKIKQREVRSEISTKGISQGLHPILAKLVAARPMPQQLTPLDIVYPKLGHLDGPKDMADIDIAVDRVCRAIVENEVIGIETDHDCDGQTSHAVLYYNLVDRFKHPADKVRSYIGHRMQEGYGLSDLLATRIINDEVKPSLIITADNGSSDELRIKRLKDEGIDVIVTDHHQIPLDGHPKSAYAFLNPTREDCNYPDSMIAGCMVAWLLMAAVRNKLVDDSYLPKDTPNLSDSLDYVAVGTIADCVSIARSKNNRAVVRYGLKLIEEGLRPCWRAIKHILNGPISSEDLGFKVGPLLNSDGRLACAFGSVNFLLSKDDDEAFAWVEQLKKQNEERKAIQKQITDSALIEAIRQYQNGAYGLSIYLEDGHSGVHGISASRIKEVFGRPTAIFAPKLNSLGVITGSIRGVDGFHVRDALTFIAKNSNEENFLISYGGHSGAGGVSLRHENLEKFTDLFDKASKVQLSSDMLGPVLYTDGELEPKDINLDLVDLIDKAGPYGREFEAPVFELNGKIAVLTPVGDGTHARVVINSHDKNLKGIWFKMRNKSDDLIPVAIGDMVKVAFSPKKNEYQGSSQLDIMVLHMEKLS